MSKYHFPAVPDAVLSCEFRTEKDQNPRIEWKKKGKTVAFVYFNGKFTGERCVYCSIITPGCVQRLSDHLSVGVQEPMQDGQR